MLDRKHAFGGLDAAAILAAMGRARDLWPTSATVGSALQQVGATMRRMSIERTPPQDLQAAGAGRDQVQDLDPHLAERLQQLRHGLGLSVTDMAQRVGLWGRNGADNLRQMERCARPIPGTLQVLLGYMERELQAARRD